jgi:hypothetical protein
VLQLLLLVPQLLLLVPQLLLLVPQLLLLVPQLLLPVPQLFYLKTREIEEQVIKTSFQERPDKRLGPSDTVRAFSLTHLRHFYPLYPILLTSTGQTGSSTTIFIIQVWQILTI